MTLIGAILKKVQSKDSINKKYSSPPPEINEDILKPKKKKYVDKYAHVKSIVDSTPPRLNKTRDVHNLCAWRDRLTHNNEENIRLLIAMKRIYLMRGKVDCRWKNVPPRTMRYYDNRVNFFKRIQRENKALYKRFMNAEARVPTTASLNKEWSRNIQEILCKCQAKFVMFPLENKEEIEDMAFAPPLDVKRLRVSMTLRVKGAATLGDLRIELFTDVCPKTCQLFMELLEGDGVGYGYIGTSFFRKVPHLYWSGGDVIYNNGFGCYAQKGRIAPIGAENYHFSHSMPGLLSMKMTKDDEMCGIFNITFKPLPQFDLKNVIFGRVIRPCGTYNSIIEFGSPLSTHPVVEIVAAKRLR